MPTTASAAQKASGQSASSQGSSTQGSTASGAGSLSRRAATTSAIIPILARKVREVEEKAQRGKLGPTNRVKFQVIAFLVREERARVKADTDPGRFRALRVWSASTVSPRSSRRRPRATRR